MTHDKFEVEPIEWQLARRQVTDEAWVLGLRLTAISDQTKAANHGNYCTKSARLGGMAGQKIWYDSLEGEVIWWVNYNNISSSPYTFMYYKVFAERVMSFKVLS